MASALHHRVAASSPICRAQLKGFRMSGNSTAQRADQEQVAKLLAVAGATTRREVELSSILNSAIDLCAARASSVLSVLRMATERRVLTESQALQTAPDYNLFSLIDRSDWEFTHDRILANLLNPYGSHGQRTLFLQLFLDLLAERARDATHVRARKIADALREVASSVSELPRPHEWRISRQTDRIDIRVENPSIGLLIFIENKIRAREGPDQIDRYMSLLEQERRRFQNRLFVLLARDDSYSPVSGTPHLQLSYRRDVQSWLSQAVDKITASHVQGVIRQYVKFIADWGRETMSNAWENELMNLLRKEEHIAAALEIGHVIEPLGTRLWSDFFDIAAKRIRDRFPLLGSDRWQIASADYARTHPPDGVCCILQPERGLQIFVGLIPQPPKVYWDWGEFAALGVGFSVPNASPDIPEVARLRTTLNKDGYRTNEYTEWWVGRRTKVFSVGDEFMIDCVKNINAVADRAADLILDVLSKHGSEIEAADNALASTQRPPT